MTTRPRLDEMTARPRVDEMTSRPRLDEMTTRPRLDEMTARPRLDEMTTRPRLDEMTARPRLDEMTARSRHDSLRSAQFCSLVQEFVSVSPASSSFVPSICVPLQLYLYSDRLVEIRQPGNIYTQWGGEGGVFILHILTTSNIRKIFIDLLL